MPIAGIFRQKIFGIDVAETTFERRGFAGGPAPVRAHLERIGQVFVRGYHHALGYPQPDALARRLGEEEAAFRGFAFEGAAMGLALLDRLTPWNRQRLGRFLAGPGEAHAYMVHVAIGWVIGRLGGNVNRIVGSLDPLLGWLAVEGYGFHEGFFHGPLCLHGQPAPARLNGYARRVFDQGLGRSLWFSQGAEPGLIAQTIGRFSAARHPDLWSGVGLSSAYAGGVGSDALQCLFTLAGFHQPALAQGAAFAAKARQRAGNLTPHTDNACRMFCGISAPDAAQVTDEALENLREAHQPAFEVWRQRIQARFAHPYPSPWLSHHPSL